MPSKQKRDIESHERNLNALFTECNYRMAHIDLAILRERMDRVHEPSSNLLTLTRALYFFSLNR